MTDQLTATIIPFPVRIRPPQVDAASQAFEAALAVLPSVPAPPRQQASDLSHSSQRLTQALADLQLALADQKDATQRWKRAIEDLAAKMRTLGEVGATQKKSG